LSKAVLLGEEPPESTYLHKQDFYAANGIDVTLNTHVDSIAPDSREVMLDGRSVEYSKLLLCTGSRVRTMQGLGGSLLGVHYLRTLSDCRELAKDLRAGRRLVSIGGGFIGLEVASSAVKLGLTATVVEQKQSLLDRVVPADVASQIEQLHVANGVNIRLNSAVVKLHGKSRVESVELASGATLPADVVVIGIGVIPNTELAEAAGAECENGVLVDQYGRTSLPDVYAAGDLTNHMNPILGKRLRLESWQNAQNQAISVAKNMLGLGNPYSEVPWFWSEQLGHSIQLLGVANPEAEIFWRGDRKSRRYMAFAFEAGRLTSAVAFNVGNELRFAKRLIEAGAEIAPRVICDTSVALRDMAANARQTIEPAQSQRLRPSAFASDSPP
jgi:3-phenylpropionate/trans-cinnamate dioxygenase ferredoxin reductase subunit